MDANLKKTLRSISLDLRHTLEGRYDDRGDFHPGDLERRLNALGIWRDRPAKPLAELTHLSSADKEAREVVDAYIAFRAEAGVGQSEAVAEFVREAAYNWANRLLCLRCMEARGIIDEVILQKEVYGWRSMVHSRLGRQEPALLASPDEGLFTVLFREFELRSRELPNLFNPKAPAIGLRPSLAALKHCIGLLSGTAEADSNGPATDEVFAAPDALGWAYQYWNAEEKDRVFEKVRTQRGTKIEGADIIPATQLYTEPYMVKFLVQNSLGALWVGMHPDSNLADGWEYYVRDADRAPVEHKRVQAITFLDPACGSGHFHLEAFDLLYAMYAEEGGLSEPEDICAAILNHNLYGVDIDERAVQIAQAALWMKAKEIAWNLAPEALIGFHHHFVATNIRLPRGKDHLETFLKKNPEDLPLRPALETVFEGLENAHELGSLLQLEEPVEKELRFLRGKQEDAQQEGFQTALFVEMDRPQQRKLPLGVESYAAWKDKVLSQLREDFEAESEAADLTLAFFGQSAGKGLALFDILARRYDVVAANPPYMGSSSLSQFFRNYVSDRYTAGKRDLYSAFIMRCYELARPSGRLGMVTQQSWMFLKSFVDLRASETTSSSSAQEGFRGVLKDTWIELLPHLGPRAFSEISGEVVNVALFVLSKSEPADSVNITAYRLVGAKSPEEKERLLLNAIKCNDSSYTYRVPQERLVGLPLSVLAYWLPPQLIEVLGEATKLPIIAESRAGLTTGNSERFYRYFWELPSLTEWLLLANGGSYSRWYGLEASYLRWGNGFQRVLGELGNKLPSQEYYRRPGLSISQAAQGSLGCRLMDDAAFTNSSIPVFPNSGVDRVEVAALLNTFIASFFIRVISQKIGFEARHLDHIPIARLSKSSVAAARLALDIKLRFVRTDITERCFDNPKQPEAEMLLDAIRLSGEAFIETEFASALNITSSLDAVYAETRKPVGLNHLLSGYDSFPEVPTEELHVPADISKSFDSIERVSLSHDELLSLRHQLRELFAAGPGEKPNSELFLANEDEELLGAYVPVPSETFLEELSDRLRIHPVSTFWLLKEGVEQEEWRCLPEERRRAEDLLTVTVLRLLGYRWPEQIRTEEPVPAWADKDGVIPISSGGHGEATLYDRVRERIADEFPNRNSGIEREFAELVDERLSDWLSRSFYQRHISQFKKRPIAWQLETTTSGRGRGNPAFSCLIYYHRLDADLLPKIRSQYIRDLRRGYETEQRTLRQMNQRSAAQDARLLQLDAWLDELNAFTEKLEHVAEYGFGDTVVLQTQLRQYAIDDAMQSLKATWLRRLAGVVADGPLADWQARADETDIHPELRDWIAVAVDNLHHHCTIVGAKSPQARKLKTDPGARALAAVIGTEATSMVKEAITLACGAWYDEVDGQVLKPQLEERKAVDSEAEELQGKLDEMADLDPERYQLEKRIKALKAKSKKIRKQRRDIRKAAKELREHIEAWAYPEAAGWTEWLGTQPLFDKFASADGKKAPPRTIDDFVAQESRYDPDINDGVRVNIAPLQKAGLLAAAVLSDKDVDQAIADRADWRADERRWCREGKLPRPGWWVDQDRD